MIFLFLRTYGFARLRRLPLRRVPVHLAVSTYLAVCLAAAFENPAPGGGYSSIEIASIEIAVPKRGGCEKATNLISILEYPVFFEREPYSSIEITVPRLLDARRLISVRTPSGAGREILLLLLS